MILTTALCVWLAVYGRRDGVQVGNVNIDISMSKAAGNSTVPATQKILIALNVCLSLLFLVPLVLGRWKVYEKAGLPGWGAVVPIYNTILLLKVARRPLWWLLLYVIPLINLIPLVLVPLGIARNFDKTGRFATGLIFLGFIFYPILGFGPSQYQRSTYVRFHAGEPYVT